MTGGLLVVGAHPDDEVMLAGGTLAACSRAGVPTGVVCLTRGAAGPISNAALASRENLADIRTQELRAACSELGVQWLRTYDHPDGNLRWADSAAAVEEIAQALQDRRPRAVVSFGEDGIYYHPDHIATFHFVREALSRVVHRPAFYRTVWPKALARELTRELQQRRLPSSLWGIDPGHFGVDTDEVSLELDVSPFVARKLSALRSHRTQLDSDNAFTALPVDLAQRYLGVERFAVVDPGEDDAIGWLQAAIEAGRARI